MLRLIKFFFYYRFVRIESCEKAKAMGLKFEQNVYGDAINRYNCRSFWYDNMGLRYRVNDLYNE